MKSDFENTSPESTTAIDICVFHATPCICKPQPAKPEPIPERNRSALRRGVAALAQDAFGWRFHVVLIAVSRPLVGSVILILNVITLVFSPPFPNREHQVKQL